MNSESYPAESHPYDEALLVLEGCMNLEVEGKQVAVEQGEVFVVPAGLAHAVAAGSHGILVIVDQ